MSKSNTFEAELLAHIFQNAAIALVGDATGLPAAGAAGSLFLSLHTADPGEAGTQATNEVAYTGYARKAVARNNTEWVVSGTAPTQVALANRQSFPARSDVGSAVATHWGVGAVVSGATKLLYSGALDASITITQGATPYIEAGSKITED